MVSANSAQMKAFGFLLQLDYVRSAVLSFLDELDAARDYLGATSRDQQLMAALEQTRVSAEDFVTAGSTVSSLLRQTRHGGGS